METTSLFDLLSKLNMTDDQVKEFFVYYTSELVEIQIQGILEGLKLAGKDLDSEQGKMFEKELRAGYQDKLPSICQSMIDDFSRFIIDGVTKALDLNKVVETVIAEPEAPKKKPTTRKKTTTTPKKPTDRKKPAANKSTTTTKKRTTSKKEADKSNGN